MDTKDAGRKGGSAKTEAKRQSSRANVAKARAVLAERRKRQRAGL